MRLGERDDLAHLGDAADLGHTGLRDVDGTLLEAVGEIVQARGILARGNPRLSLAADARGRHPEISQFSHNSGPRFWVSAFDPFAAFSRKREWPATAHRDHHCACCDHLAIT
jgi:hypothetical protein